MFESSERKTNAMDLVLNHLKKLQEEKVKFGEDVDLNLTCSVIPSSIHLSIELESNYLNLLGDIVELWRKALLHGMDQLPSSEEYEFWLENVKLVAYLYELFGEYNQSCIIWVLFYKIGKLCKNDSSVLLGKTLIVFAIAYV